MTGTCGWLDFNWIPRRMSWVEPQHNSWLCFNNLDNRCQLVAFHCYILQQQQKTLNVHHFSIHSVCEGSVCGFQVLTPALPQASTCHMTLIQLCKLPCSSCYAMFQLKKKGTLHAICLKVETKLWTPSRLLQCFLCTHNMVVMCFLVWTCKSLWFENL